MVEFTWGGKQYRFYDLVELSWDGRKTLAGFLAAKEWLVTLELDTGIVTLTIDPTKLSDEDITVFMDAPCFC